MIASAYIKDGNIHLYNERGSFSNLGGLAYELGKPLLNFLCYEQAQSDDGFSVIASVFDDEYAHVGAREPEFIAGLNEVMADQQQQGEVYLFFYSQILIDFVYTFIDSPQEAIEQLVEKIPSAKGKLEWVKDFRWPTTSAPYPDKDKKLFRAVQEVVALLSADFELAQEATAYVVELLMILREEIDSAETSSMEYFFIMEELLKENTGHFHFIENPFRVFYGIADGPEIVLLFEIESIKDLCYGLSL